MEKNILVIDDDKEIENDVSPIITKIGFNLFYFSNFDKGFEYIKNNSDKILAYFVDMKPLQYIPDKPNKETKEYLDLPETIFNYLNDKKLSKNFHFMSACRSSHDVGVLNRTKAKYFDKEDIRNLEFILKDLS